MRIGFLMGRSFTGEGNTPEILRLLRERGATAQPVHLGDDLIDVGRVRLDYDLYVLRSRSDLTLSVAADLHRAGAAVLNPYPVAALLRDRIVASRVLRAAGVPVPETFVASHVSQLLPALDRGPLIIKPHRRSRTHSSAVARDAAELSALGPIEEPVFAQRYHPPDGRYRKIYSIGGELFGLLRAWPARTREERMGRPFAVEGELADIARRCGAAFGIDLFSVDIVVSSLQAYVVDMSSVPGFTGVPDGPARLAQYFYGAAERAARGEPIVPADSPVMRAELARQAALSAAVIRSDPGTTPPNGTSRRVAVRLPQAHPEDVFLLEERTTELGNGTSRRDYVWVRGQYVLVVPVSDGGVVFIRQYKKAAEQTLLVLPWGGIERDESPLDAGRRELEEETGYSFASAEVYGPFYDLPDKSTGGHWVIVARNAYRKANAAPDEGEQISGIELIPVEQLWQHHIPVLMHVGALRLAGL